MPYAISWNFKQPTDARVNNEVKPIYIDLVKVVGSEPIHSLNQNVQTKRETSGTVKLSKRLQTSSAHQQSNSPWASMDEYLSEPPKSPIQDKDEHQDYQLQPRRSRRLHQNAMSEEARLSDSSPPTSDTLILSLVLQTQGPCQPKHWVLYVAPEGKPGKCYQVFGDGLTFQYCATEKPINIKATRTYWNLFELATITTDQAAMVSEIARQEPPPWARIWESRRENCQGWTVRVLEKLKEKKVVPASNIKMVRDLMESV